MHECVKPYQFVKEDENDKFFKEKEWFDDFMKEHLTREWFTKDEFELLKDVFGKKYQNI